MGRGIAVVGGFGHDGNHVEKVAERILVSRINEVEHDSRDGSFLPFAVKVIGHRRTDQVFSADEQRMEVGVGGLCGRGNPDSCRERSGLMMVIQDHGIPLSIDGAGDIPGLRQVIHVGIAVVIMACIKVVQPGHGTHFIGCPHVGMVPFGQHLHPVGIGKHEEKNGVFPDEAGFGIFGCSHIIGKLDGALGRGTFAGMDAHIDPHDGSALCGEAACLLVGQVLHPGKPLRYLLVPFEVCHVLL